MFSYIELNVRKLKQLRNSFNTISLLVCESVSDGGMIVVSKENISEYLASVLVFLYWLFSDAGMIVVFGSIIVSCFARESCLIWEMNEEDKVLCI